METIPRNTVAKMYFNKILKYLLHIPHSCIQLYNFLLTNYSCKRDIWKESELLGNRDVDLECLVLARFT